MLAIFQFATDVPFNHFTGNFISLTSVFPLLDRRVIFAKHLDSGAAFSRSKDRPHGVEVLRLFVRTRNYVAIRRPENICEIDAATVVKKALLAGLTLRHYRYVQFQH